ncbi:hypothetical protein HPP92_023060 [Vanilla planifolia]|uniref:Uncharacterized protein n=1 Tax=Vanilla planifolia TaxID=51239 RepID=A0A835PYQ2_VANPL|nr:hypothetical protein HPP92_023060 [Vanilla planifolia]
MRPRAGTSELPDRTPEPQVNSSTSWAGGRLPTTPSAADGGYRQEDSQVSCSGARLAADIAVAIGKPNGCGNRAGRYCPLVSSSARMAVS